MSITCRFYKKTEFGNSIDIIEKLNSKFSDNKSIIYDRRDPKENGGQSLKLKIHYVREKENKYGKLIVLAIDLPMKIMDYEKSGEEKFIIKHSQIIPIQLFNGEHDNFIALLCPKPFTEGSINAINALLSYRNKNPFDGCSINLNGESFQEEMTRFWVGELQDHHSKSASVGGTHLKGKDDYKRYVQDLSGVVKAITIKAKNGNFEYGISRDGNFWIKSAHMDDQREKFIKETLDILKNQGVIN
ncbi:MAG: hypothetical protein AABX29_10210 [Nanoarchaeota archaeon]